MIVLGDPKHECASGNKCTLHFLQGDTVVAIVHNDIVQKFNVARADTGVALVELHLAGPKGSGLAQLSDDWTVEIHVKTRQLPEPHRLAKANIDLWELDYDEKECRLHIQGRSPCGVLIDEPCRYTFTAAAFVADDRVQRARMQTRARLDAGSRT